VERPVSRRGDRWSDARREAQRLARNARRAAQRRALKALTDPQRLECGAGRVSHRGALEATIAQAEEWFPLVVARLRSGYYAALQPREGVVVAYQSCDKRSPR
jgi:hypothetical protein